VTPTTLGTFIQPDRSVEDQDNLHEQLGCTIFSGWRATDQAQLLGLIGQNKIFDAIWQRWHEVPLNCEDQCSAQYYFDVVRTLRDFNGEFSHVVEVGCYLGGASSILAGCMDKFDFTLDIVDLHAPYLRFAYERIRRMYPEAEGRVRLFHGDLPSYVREVMLEEARKGVVVHHDGAHDFSLVVKDMAALSFVRDQLHAIIAQDTHLRGTVKHMNFVDMALYAVFGTDLNYAPIGAQYGEFDSQTCPNSYQGNYFLPGQAEGFVIPMAVNDFRYPHPTLPMEHFLPPAIVREQAA
jgi:hypothetical protein